MYLYVKIGTYTLAVLRYAEQNEPEGVYYKDMYQGWTRLPIGFLQYNGEDQTRAVEMVKDGLPVVARAYVTTEGDL